MQLTFEIAYKWYIFRLRKQVFVNVYKFDFCSAYCNRQIVIVIALYALSLIVSIFIRINYFEK